MQASSPLVPRTSRRTRLAFAALLWTTIGAGLLAAGVHWLLGARSAAATAALPVALVLGWLKGRFVLGPRAEANALRIVEAGEARCVGGVFSWGSWGIALLMLASGIALRHSSLPRPWLGVLYVAIGTALIVASFRGWTRFREFVRRSRTAQR